MQAIRICSKNTGIKFDTEKCVMLIIKSGKRPKGKEWNYQIKIESEHREKENNKYLRILETSRNESKNKKRTPQTNEKTSQN